jgi:ribosome modulation factor
MISFSEIIKEKEKSHAYMDGVEGFRDKATCPYVIDSKEFNEWMSGYMDADFLDRLLNES